MGLFDGSGMFGLGFGPDISDMFGLTQPSGVGLATGFQAGQPSLTSDMLIQGMNTKTPGYLGELYKYYGDDQFFNAVGKLSPDDQVRIGTIMGNYPSDTFSNQTSSISNLNQNSQGGQLGGLWNTMTSKPVTNAVGMGLMGYNAYNQGKLANSAMDTMEANTQRADEAWQREKERQDKTSQLNF